MVAGSASHSDDEPSMSVNTNVTRPVGAPAFSGGHDSWTPSTLPSADTGSPSDVDSVDDEPSRSSRSSSSSTT
jgi:hypothetical protein